MKKPTALFLALVLSVAAGERPSKSQRLLRWSRAAIAATAAADVATSYGRQEANPLLRGSRGEFGMRGVSIKLGIVGAAFLVERVIVRRHPEAATSFAVANFAGAALVGGVAVRNARIPR